MTISRSLFSSDREDWATPQDLFDRLHAEFNFTIDLAAAEHNAKLPRFYTKEQNSLKQDWSNERGWLNPPYGNKTGHWLRKAHESGSLVVLLLPARTDTRWFHRWVLGKGAEVRFIKGRLMFVGAKDPAPFPSMIVIYRPKEIPCSTKS